MDWNTVFGPDARAGLLPVALDRLARLRSTNPRSYWLSVLVVPQPGSVAPLRVALSRPAAAEAGGGSATAGGDAAAPAASAR